MTSTLVSLCSKKCAKGRLCRAVQDNEGDELDECKVAVIVSRLCGVGCQEDQSMGVALMMSIIEDAGSASRMDCFDSTNAMLTDDVCICNTHIHDGPLPHVMYNLGLCYEHGDGVEQDKHKAFELYERASEMGNSNAIYALGVCYEHGDGVEQDKHKSFELNQRASEMGNPYAMINLGVCYEHGYGVRKNKHNA